jgi:hypothetical protein
MSVTGAVGRCPRGPDPEDGLRAIDRGEIARAFLGQTTTMAARITRAKKALTEANVPFEVPVGDELADRLSSVLEAVYLVFNEGYTATVGEQWARAELCHTRIIPSATAADSVSAAAIRTSRDARAPPKPSRKGTPGFRDALPRDCV